MADLYYLVSVGADEASAKNPLIANSFLVELVCRRHADVLESDAIIAASDVAREVIKHHFPELRQPSFLAATRVEDVAESQAAKWNRLSCGCRAVLTPNRWTEANKGQ
ncbi:MAG: hypothetical protein JOZ08_15860 [Verrucomicrobia bacterium]|nr:hypothetical protein [Verrucomicrobiota bacterium]MBV8280403.1 hypothetical protein [Verrucomicrobiota bacterium]